MPSSVAVLPRSPCRCAHKLIQAAGRLIRSEEDFGEVVLLDSRVYHKKYAAQLPSLSAHVSGSR